MVNYTKIPFELIRRAGINDARLLNYVYSKYR